MEADDKRLKFVPFEEAARIKPGLAENFIDYWWVVHPEKGVCYYMFNDSTAPQCNANKAVTERLLRMYPWAELRQMPLVSRNIDPHDYA